MVVLGDDRPRRRLSCPWVTWMLIALTLAQFGLSLAYPEIDWLFAFQVGAQASLPVDAGLAGAVLHVFAHTGFAHVLGNLIVLYVFGDNVEDALGHVRFLLFYALAAAGGALAWRLTVTPPAVLVGASGAIAGVMAAYLMLHPQARILVLVFGKVPALVPAAWAVGGHILLNVAMILFGIDGAVAWWTHIGGFLTGFALLPLLKHPEVALLEREEADGREFPWLRRVLFDLTPRQLGSRWTLVVKAFLYIGVMIVLDQIL